ncbi:MAG: prolipoprotein diacylglyceryl transferase [Desulfovibrio sp.]
MHPILFSIGPITIYMYGLFMAAAFMTGIGWTMREARERGLNEERVHTLSLIAAGGAILGARGLYVLINPTYYINHPAEIIQFWSGGLVFSGGFVVAVLGGYLYMRSQNEPLFDWMDAIAISMPLAQAVGRVGCLFAGCCYGGECSLPWGVTFTDPDSLAPLGIELHPTQVYHSLAGLTTFAILFFASKKITKPGVIAGMYLVLFPVFRIIIEFFRSDYRGDAGIMSATQMIALLICIPGLYLIFRKTNTE